MGADLASSNVNRNVTLAGTSIAIFTFLLFFLYPRYQSGEVNGVLFQFTLAVIVTVTFSLVTSATYYYGNTIRLIVPSERPSTLFGKAEAAWLVGYGLLLLEPSLILFTISLWVLGFYALILWLGFLYLTWKEYQRQTRKK